MLKRHGVLKKFWLPLIIPQSLILVKTLTGFKWVALPALLPRGVVLVATGEVSIQVIFK